MPRAYSDQYNWLKPWTWDNAWDRVTTGMFFVLMVCVAISASYGVFRLITL